MGARFTRLGGGSPLGNYGRMSREVRTIMNQELTPLAQAGVGEAQGYINIAGTGHVWGPGWPSGAPRGRVQSGEMRDAVEYRITQGQTLRIDIGWLRNYKEYFGAQESGFSAGGFRPSQTVEGMGMFQHLRVYMRVKLTNAGDRVIERVANGL